MLLSSLLSTECTQVFLINHQIYLLVLSALCSLWIYLFCINQNIQVALILSSCIISKYFLSVLVMQVTTNGSVQFSVNMLKANNRNTRTRCEIWSKLTIKTYFTRCSNVSIVNFKQVNAGWVTHFRAMFHFYIPSNIVSTPVFKRVLRTFRKGA